jgi:copper chaperone CopZ
VERLARAFIGAVVAVVLLGASPVAAGTEELKLRVDGMVCPFCAATVESVLRSQAGVREAEASFLTGTALVVYDPTRTDPATIVAALHSKTLYRVRAVTADDPWVSPGTGVAGTVWLFWAAVVLLVTVASLGLAVWRRRAACRSS